MNNKPFYVLARLLCLPAILLLVSGIAGADGTSLFEYSKKTGAVNLHIDGDGVETSAECEERVAKQAADAQAVQSKASGMMVVGEDCRSQCTKTDAPMGHKWYGRAPTCSGDEMNKNTKAAKNCTNLGGEVVDWSYCGDGKSCATGNKILCKLPSDDVYEELAGVEGIVTWFGRPPACSKTQASKDCTDAGGTVAMESKCTDGSSGQKVDCCTTGKMVACVLPVSEPTTFLGEQVETDVQWFGKAPACNANKGEKDCADREGTVEKKAKCTDGTDGKKQTCCTTGKKVKCVIPKITGG